MLLVLKYQRTEEQLSLQPRVHSSLIMAGSGGGVKAPEPLLKGHFELSAGEES